VVDQDLPSYFSVPTEQVISIVVEMFTRFLYHELTGSNMAETGKLTWPVKRKDDFFRIVAYIGIATVLIFVIDISTPLGLVNWILYLIPCS
jgi:hypothetical protein